MSEQKRKQIKGRIENFAIKSFFQEIDKTCLLKVAQETGVQDLEFLEVIKTNNSSEIKKYYDEKQDKLPDNFLIDCAYINDFRKYTDISRLINTAKKYNINISSIDETALNLSALIYLENKEIFEKLQYFLQAETTDNFIDYKTAPFELEDICPQDIEKIKENIQEFLIGLGQGENLEIEKYTFSDKIILYIWEEGYLQTRRKFNRNNQLTSINERPTKYSLIVISPSLGKIRIKTKKYNIDKILRKHLGTLCTNEENCFDDTTNKCLDLSILKENIDNKESFPLDPRNFDFVKLVGIKFKYSENSRDFYEIRKEDNLFLELKDRGFDLSAEGLIIVQAHIKVKLNKRARPKTIKLTAPNKLKLDDTLDDQLIENLLINWGLVS